MDRNNVLVIAYYFPPMGLSGVQRTAKFVKFLPEYGWNPVVLTVGSDPFYAFDDSMDADLGNPNINIYRTNPDSAVTRKEKSFPSYFRQKIGRAVLQTLYQPDSKIKWKKQALKLGEKIIKENNISVIFATAPPFTDFLIAKELSSRFDLPFIIDYRDVWIDNPYHFYATPMHRRYSIRLEENILKHTEKVIVTTRHTKELLLRRYNFIKHDEIVIIPHGYDTEDFIPYSNIKPNPEKFTITHSGLFQDDRTPKYFFKALSSFLRKNPSAYQHVEARFVGIMRKSHLKYIKKYKLQDNVACTGYMPHNETVRNLVESDVLWLMLKDTVRSPGKLYEYFGASKPLLVCAPDGVISRTAMDTKAAITVEPVNVKEIESAISTFYELWKSKTLPEPNKEFTEQFQRNKLTGDLARELALATEI